MPRRGPSHAPPRKALGVRCLEDRPALLGLGVRGRDRSGGARDGLARGPDGIRATLTLIAAYRDQARGYQARLLNRVLGIQPLDSCRACGLFLLLR